MQHFEKLLAGGGEWEVSKGRGKTVTPSPGFLWEALWAYHPQSAHMAADAVDAASAAHYFEVRRPSSARVFPDRQTCSVKLLILNTLSWRRCSWCIAVNHSTASPHELRVEMELSGHSVQSGASSSDASQQGDVLARLALAAAAAAALERTPGQAAKQAAAAPAQAINSQTAVTLHHQQHNHQSRPAAAQQPSLPALPQPGATGQEFEPAAQQHPAVIQGPAHALQPGPGPAQLFPHLYQHPHSTSHHRPPDESPAAYLAARPLQQPSQQPPVSGSQPAAYHAAQLQALASMQPAAPSATTHPPSLPPPSGSVPAMSLPAATPQLLGAGLDRSQDAAQALTLAAQAREPGLHQQPHLSQGSLWADRQQDGPVPVVNGQPRQDHQPSPEGDEDVYAGEEWQTQAVNGHQEVAGMQPALLPSCSAPLGSTNLKHAGIMRGVELLEAEPLPNGHGHTHWPHS